MILDRPLRPGAVMAERVNGRVSVEVDAHAVNHVSAITSRVRRMRDMFFEQGIPPDKVLYKIPCTWQGVQAVSILESEGVCCHVTHVCCVEQAAAAARADATLVQVYVARIRTWYAKHPDALLSSRMRGGSGSRSDASESESGKDTDSEADSEAEAEDEDVVDPGVQLVRQISALVRKEHYKAKVVASSVRGREDAKALAGCDYLILNDRVIGELNRNFRRVDPEPFYASTCPTVGTVSEGLFKAAMWDSPGAEEIERAVACGIAADDSLREYVRNKDKAKHTAGAAHAEMLKRALERATRETRK